MITTETLQERWSGQDSRDVTARPFGIDIDGSSWWCVTNGKVFVALRGPVANPLENIPAGTADKILRVAPDPARIALAELHAFVGEPDWTVEECARCMGTGEVLCVCAACGNEHMPLCQPCHGTGARDSVYSIRPGYICSVALNLNLVARALDGLEADTVGVEAFVINERASAIRFSAHDWTVAVMGIYLPNAPTDGFDSAPFLNVHRDG